MQALITSTTTIVTEAAATAGHIDHGLFQRLAPRLDANQVAWSRLAKRWGEFTSTASRTDPALVAPASEIRAAIAAIVTNQNRWATADQLASGVDLANTVKTLHLSIVASVDIANVARNRSRPSGPHRSRAHHRHEGPRGRIAVEQGETRYEGVAWTTPRQIAADQLIPLPEPVRRGLINLTDDVIATTNQSVAAAVQLDPSDVTRSVRSGPEARRGRSVEALRIARLHDPGAKGPSR